MDKIVVDYEGKPCYTIMLTNQFHQLYEALAPLKLKERKLCIVTDSTVAPLYLKEVEMQLALCCKEVISFVFQAGEQSKNLEVINQIYGKMIEAKFDRKDVLVALGGGVVGDMTGFAAATYLRGIRFIQIPTTLLSMVDSSIGGKTGVDYRAYKNMVGAFHQPSAVYMNLNTLKTLTQEQYRSGMGEVVKHALIKSQEYYDWLKEHKQNIMDRDLDTMQEMVYQSLLIKKEVVEIDPKELGIRAMLNYGHTLGHAIEKNMNFTMLHGDCVAIGMVSAAYLSWKRGLITREECEEIKSLITAFTLPCTIRNLSADEILETTKSDKKMEAGQIKFILLKELGKAYIDDTVTEDEMRDALHFVLQ